MGQCSSRTSEQFNEFTSLTSIKMCEKRTPGIPHGKWRTDVYEAAADRRRRGHGHGDCSGLVFVADTTGGVWIDKTLGRQRWARGCEVMVAVVLVASWNLSWGFQKVTLIQSIIQCWNWKYLEGLGSFLDIRGRSTHHSLFLFVWFPFTGMERLKNVYLKTFSKTFIIKCSFILN